MTNMDLRDPENGEVTCFLFDRSRV